MKRMTTVQFDIELLASRLYLGAYARGMSHQDLAAEAGVSASTVCRIVRHRKRPDVDSLAKLLVWLGVPFEEFIKREAEGASPLAAVKASTRIPKGASCGASLTPLPPSSPEGKGSDDT
jgi:transcriptional regulator with XRE-family HTH domain